MQIENYTDSREKEILSLIKDMHEEEFVRWGQKLELDKVYKMIGELRNHSFLLIKDNKCIGVFAGQIAYHPMNHDEIFQQVIWYVDKNYRHYSVRFMKQVEKILRGMGTKILVTTLLYNKQFDRRSKLLKKLGFLPLETHFLKSL